MSSTIPSSTLPRWSNAPSVTHPDLDPGPVPVVNPPRARRLPSVPDDWTVWAFTDVHGVASGLEPALREAGLIDPALRWIAPPRTALIGCGDYVDRGRASRRVVELLRRLENDARAAGSAVLLARGNHEHLLLQLAAGESRDFETWLFYGGRATLAAWGLEGMDPKSRSTLLALDGVTPGVLAWLGALSHAVRWRDVLFVHGGLPQWAGLDDLGVTTDLHLFVRSEFFDATWESGVFDRFEAEGVRRVVFGHTPQPGGPRLFHGGRSIALDTNACGNPRMPTNARRMVTLLELHGDVAFADARMVVVPTEGAPDASDADGTLSASA
jgi:3',5'-cyclic AMP phosphodiesterase CpdA